MPENPQSATNAWKCGDNEPSVHPISGYFLGMHFETLWHPLRDHGVVQAQNSTAVAWQKHRLCALAATVTWGAQGR